MGFGLKAVEIQGRVFILAEGMPVVCGQRQGTVLGIMWTASAGEFFLTTGRLGSGSFEKIRGDVTNMNFSCLLRFFIFYLAIYIF